LTTEIERISLLPKIPAVYALYGGRGQGLYVAYVGVADRLRNRIEQHLVMRTSSVTRGDVATGLNPEQVTERRWWSDDSFVERPRLEAAELVAFDVLNPVLRSRGRIEEQARAYYGDPAIHQYLQTLFVGPSTGRLILPTLQDALDRIASLQRQIEVLAQRLDRMKVGK
jgi:hypothetical protein